MRRNAGFTLIELVVAVTISGLVVLLVQRMFAAAGASGRALETSRTALDREANARRWLRAALLSLDVGDSAGSFEGRPDRLSFATWLQTPGVWFERRRVDLTLDGGKFVAGLGSTEHAAVRDDVKIALSDSVANVAFDYLLEPGADTKWVREWVSPVSAPLAVRIRVERPRATDTLLLLIKERG